MSNSPTEPRIRLTAQQRADFDRNGFIIVRGALSPAEVEHYLALVDTVSDEFRADKNLAVGESVEIRNAISRTDDLLPLLDHPAAFPLIADILGWSIQLTTSHIFVREPNPDKGKAFRAIDWHADGPNPRPERIEGPNGPVETRLYAKIGYFLTDLSRPDSGNLRVVPGSHKRAAPPEIDPETGDPRGAIQVLTNPGDAVLFENRTWHAVGPNFADHARKNIYFGYCYRWVKPIDYVTQSPELIARATPIQRQLLGHATDALSFYLPDRYKDDTPLREWF